MDFVASLLVIAIALATVDQAMVIGRVNFGFISRTSYQRAHLASKPARAESLE